MKSLLKWNLVWVMVIFFAINFVCLGGCVKESTTVVDSMTFDDEDEITDSRDGQKYKIVKIGNQWWMAENLRATQYRTGAQIPNVTSGSEWGNLTTGAWTYYDNQTSHNAVYGKLYNWFAAIDSRGLCPAGWHIPSDAEWKQLEIHLGMSQSEADTAHTSRGQNQNVGGKLKSTNYWETPNIGATNESAFSGLPGGHRDPNGFYWMGGAGYWWSTSELDNSFAWSRILNTNHSGVNRAAIRKNLGFSIRCVRD